MIQEKTVFPVWIISCFIFLIFWPTTKQWLLPQCEIRKHRRHELQYEVVYKQDGSATWMQGITENGIDRKNCLEGIKEKIKEERGSKQQKMSTDVARNFFNILFISDASIRKGVPLYWSATTETVIVEEPITFNSTVKEWVLVANLVACLN